MIKTIYKSYNDSYAEIYKYHVHNKKSSLNIFSPFVSTPDSEIERISLSRTKKNIRELALCNDFQFFSTVTINSVNCDRFSLSACQELFRKKLHKIKRVNKNFKFLFITEKHKNGAFHFHGLITDTNDFYINDNGYYSSKIFDEIGFNSHSRIKDYNKTCNYIMKYITKDCVRNEANQIYFCSRGLKKATCEEMKEFSILDLPHFYENDYVSKVSFNFNDLDMQQKLKILENFVDNSKTF